MGCVAGATDWVIISENASLLLELKHAKTLKSAIGKMRDSQKDFAKLCEDKNVHYAIAWDQDSFVEALHKSGIKPLVS
jgi:hypothetical protein